MTFVPAVYPEVPKTIATMKRDFLAIPDLSRAELESLLRLAQLMKEGAYTARPLAGKTLAMLFAKSSTRTRVSFEVGTLQLGGNAVFLSTRDVQIGRGEPIRDTARVLSRYVDGIMIRTFDHDDVIELARYASVPVINGLTDLLHPCQVLADLLTIRQEFGEDLASLRVAWVGDGNNMANSWLNAAYRFGFELRLAVPPGYEPDAGILENARRHALVGVTHDPGIAVADADVVNTDVWTSMGQEEEVSDRAQAFAQFRIDAELMDTAAERAIFLHCLPAHRDEEVTDEVLEGPRSRVFDQAENRLHVQKALLALLMGGEPFA
jgi:ornithine carbamoyltransferase